MRHAHAPLIAILVAASTVGLVGQRGAPIRRPAPPDARDRAYYPDRFEWQHKRPFEVGMDPRRVDEAVKLAIESENPRQGSWQDKPIVSPKWIEMARTPGPANENYGFANWFLNTHRKPLPAAPETAVYFEGNGANVIYIDWDHDLVAVVRWIRGGGALNEVVGKILASLG